MRPGRLFVGWLALLGAAACREQRPYGQETEPASAPSQAIAQPSSQAPTLLSSLTPVPSASVANEARAVELELQRAKLALPPGKSQRTRFVFARSALAQLTDDALVIYDTESEDFHELLREPLDQPRAVLARADGAVLALGGSQLRYWQPGWKHTKSLLRPLVLPDVELYADGQQADRLWLFDARPGSGPTTLVSYRLTEGEAGIPLPEQTIELASPRGGVVGTTREGVWLYLTPGMQERRGAGGARLAGVTLPADQQLPIWVLPTRRLDQALWADEQGELSRVLVSPTFKRLGKPVSLAGRPYTLAVGDEGRLLAAVVVTGPGPSFELELRDAELRPLARVALPHEQPTGADDWVRVVTENQQLAADPRAPRVVVGGPQRLSIFDAQGQKLFFKASR